MEEDRNCCLTVKTTDWPLNLRTCEAHETDKKRRYHLSSVRKMGRRSPSTSPSLQRRRRRQNLTLSKKAMAHESSFWPQGWKQYSVWRPRSAVDQRRQTRVRDGKRLHKCSMKQGYKSKTGEFHARNVREGKMSWCNNLRICYP